MSDLRALYQATIVEHARSPRNQGALDGATAQATADNPLCGDQVTVSVRADGERIDALRFEARGCALCCAAASIMSERVTGATGAEARALADRFERYVRAAPDTPPASDGETEALGELTAFAGVRAVRSRQACALLPFRALLEALGPRPA
ncbi:MAG TPA: SUF system NifU family Fe-S cluster assembly protein [Kofleriaceae bacterium]|nr:SUF system NifU family Fe-S cluster assembly protein [Kofleriaceae bacterium]